MSETLIVIRHRDTQNVKMVTRITPYLIRHGWHVDVPLTKYNERGPRIGAKETDSGSTESGIVYGD